MNVPVVSHQSHVIHVLDADVNPEWTDGTEGVALCNRRYRWYLAPQVIEGDRPCIKCDEKAAVMAIAFEAEIAAGVQTSHIRHDAFHAWLATGIQAGFISDVGCGVHSSPPMTDEEIEAVDRGDPPCIYMVRVYGPAGESH